MKYYSKQDSVMTKGMAILCMLMLHLFCRTGNDVLGTPVLWFNDTTPVVFWFGFFTEICVPIYSICVGYAQELLYEKNSLTWKKNAKRVLRLMVNYWVVLILFCGLGLIFDKSNWIPGTVGSFAKSIILLHSYNGAWWFLNSYVLLLLIPYMISFYPLKKLGYKSGLVVCLLFQIIWYFLTKSGMTELVSTENQVIFFINKELVNLIGIMPYIWAGAFLCKGKVIEKIGNRIDMQELSLVKRNKVLFFSWGIIFVLTNIVHKATLFGIVGVCSFVIFNLIIKGKVAKNIFLFLGKHSTNIWLVHMFFYMYLFRGLVTIVKYPLFMLGFMLVLCIGSSYIIMGNENYFCKKMKLN